MDPSHAQPPLENAPQAGPAAPLEAPDSTAAPCADPCATLQVQLQTLEQSGRNGANWFYWVAALSLVNSVVLLSGGSSYFVIGMGITLVVDVVTAGIAKESPDISTILKVFAFGFDMVVALIVVGFGWLARKGYLAVYALGMALYVLDGLLFVLFQDWMSVGFHAFVLFCMWSGFSAFRQSRAVERVLAQLPGQAQ